MSAPWGNGTPFVPVAPYFTIPRTATIVLLGDSITSSLYQWYDHLKAGADAAFGCTSSRTKPTWVNSGVSGNKTTDIVGNETARILTYSPTHLIYALGINDTVNGVTPATSSASVTSTLDTVLAALPALNIMVVGPWLWGGLKPTGSNTNDIAVDATRDAIKGVADGRGLPFVDWRANYFAGNATAADIGADSPVIHPNDPFGKRWLSAQVQRKVLLNLA